MLPCRYCNYIIIKLLLPRCDIPGCKGDRHNNVVEVQHASHLSILIVKYAGGTAICFLGHSSILTAAAAAVFLREESYT